MVILSLMILIIAIALTSPSIAPYKNASLTYFSSSIRPISSLVSIRTTKVENTEVYSKNLFTPSLPLSSVGLYGNIESSESSDLRKANIEIKNGPLTGNKLMEVSGVTSSSSSLLGEGISPILFTRLTSIIFLYSVALTYNAFYIESIGSGLSIYSGLFQVTVLSQSFDLLIYLLAALILIPWSNSFKSLGLLSVGIKNNNLGLNNSDLSSNSTFISYITGPILNEYSLIVLFSTLGSSLLLSSGNLLSMYLSLELQSFGVYILASIYRDSESATNAGLKYFLLGGLSSCLILLGCVIIYSYTGIIQFEDIYSLLVSSNTDITIITQLGLILIFIGFLFKIAAAPFHN